MNDNLTTNTTGATTQRYELVLAQTRVRFRTRHVLGLAGVTGSIGVRSGSATLDSRDRSLLAVEAVLDMRTFASASHARDRIVASPRFLDSSAHPDASYRSSSVRRRDGGWLVHGELTVKGVAAPVDLQVQAFDAADVGGSVVVTASAVIDRTHFGITVPSAMAARKLSVSIDARGVRTRGA